MRIRKGHRTLPLAPADGSFLQERSVKDGTLVRPVAGIIGGRRYQQQERARDTPMETNKRLEFDLEQHRISADDNFDECSLMLRGTGVDAPVTKVAQTPLEEKFHSTGHKPLDKPRTIFSSTASVIETRDQLHLLEQSLSHVCSRAGMFGLSARDAVAQIIEQGLPGLNEGDARMIEQVTKSFRNSSKFVECVELGRYFLQDSPASEVNKSLIIGDSEISHEEMVSSSEMVEVAKQLQSLQKSHSFSLHSGIAELSEAPSVHADNQKALIDISGLVEHSQGGRDHKYITSMDKKASSSARFRSQKVMGMDLNVTQCKRDDGKGWRCSRLAEDGYTMCYHHRKRPISQGQCRRKQGRFYSESTVSALSPPCSTYVANSRVIPDVVMAVGSWSPFLDEELAHDERRPFLKAKSMKSLLSKRPNKFLHIRKAA